MPTFKALWGETEKLKRQQELSTQLPSLNFSRGLTVQQSPLGFVAPLSQLSDQHWQPVII